MENNNNNDDTNNNATIVSVNKLDQVATWLGSTVAAAFFSSLERFSCVNLATTDPDDDEEDGEEPLLISYSSSTSNSLEDRPTDISNLSV